MTPAPRKPGATPLADRLRAEANPTALPSWLEAHKAPPRTRPLRAHSQPVAPVQPIEDMIRSEVELRVEEARQAAELEGLRMGEEKVGEVIEQYCDAIRRLGELAQVARRPDPEEVVDLALTVAQELVRGQVRFDRGVLVKMIEEALSTTGTDRGVTVRLAADDADHVRRLRPDLAEAGVAVVEDARLQVGDFEVESQQHVVDGSLAARLENVRAALVELVGENGTSVPAGPDGEEEQS